MRLSKFAFGILLLELTSLPASAVTISVQKHYENFCSADLPEFASFYCGMDRPDHRADENNNGIMDVYEPQRTVQTTIELPAAPAGYKYVPTSQASVRLSAFGDFDSDPLPPSDPALVNSATYYDDEWMDIDFDGYSMGRVFDGNTSNDRFNIGVEQGWWGPTHDRGTLWGFGGGPHDIYGDATIPTAPLASMIEDGEIIVSFGLAGGHNDLTGHAYFTPEEEYIDITITFEAELAPLAGWTPPTASFSAPAQAQTATSIVFNASASSATNSTISSYAWSFGDGNTGSGVSPSHTYSTPGEYTVVLTVRDSNNVTDSTSQTITITALPPNEAPTANFTPSDTSGFAPASIDFDASSSTDPENNISTYSWDFGDNTTGQGVNVSHTFTAPGNYNVTLTVADEVNNQDSTSQEITILEPIPNVPPLAIISFSPASTGNPLEVSFSSDNSSDPDSFISEYSWDFGDNTTSTSPSPAHLYATAGTYAVTLIVTDLEGATDTATVSVTVPDNSEDSATGETPIPQIDLTNLAAPNYRTVSFDGTASEGDIATYNWNFGDGVTGSGETSTHTYTSIGTFTATLTVTTTTGKKSSVSQNLTITNTNPIASLNASSQSGTIPFYVQFDASGSTDPDGSIDNYSWDFGDGAVSTEQAPAHSYSTAGTYTVSLTVTDNDGATNSVNTVVTVDPLPPTEINYTLEPTDDTGASNDGSFIYLSTSSNDHSYVRFDLSNIEGTVDSAIMRLYLTHAIPMTTTLYPASSDNWSETTSTPAEIGFPSYNVDSIVSVDHNGIGYVDLPVTQFIASQVAGDKVASFEVTNDNGGWKYFSSREGTNPPQLIIEASQGQGEGPSNAHPTARPVATPDTVEAGGAIQFDGSASSDDDGFINAYLWDFGDGTTSTDSSPLHSFNVPRAYEISLTVTDNNGASNTETITITVTQPEGSESSQSLSATYDIGATGNADALRLYANAHNHAFLQFDLQAVTNFVSSATLRIYSFRDASITTEIWGLDSNTLITVSGRPESDASKALLASTDHNAIGYIDFDVTDFINTGGSEANKATFELINNSPSWRPYSSAEGEYPPQLNIETVSPN